MPVISKLVALSDELRVGALAQPPYCADSGLPLEEVLGEATRNGFDYLPIRSGGRPVTSMVSRRALATLRDWGGLAEIAVPLTAEILVSADAPALSVLDRLEGNAVLFTLGAAGVDGVITIYDLNQPSTHLLGFGLVLVCEEALAEWIRLQLGSDIDTATENLRQLNAAGPGYARWKKLRETDRHGDLASALTWGEKIKVIAALGPDELARHYRLDPSDLLFKLNHVRELRNAIGHYDEGRLEDPEWVHTRMRETRDLARDLAR